MKRTPLPRSRTPIARSPIKKRPRKKSETLRIYGPPGYVEWIHEQPCIACGEFGYSEVAHIKTGGTGRKDDWTRTVPLCGRRWPDRPEWMLLWPGCHAQFHREGRQSFEARTGLSLENCAKQTQEFWALEDTETT